MKILYVEDEIPHVELTKRTLEDNLLEEFVLHHCDSYKGALEFIQSEQGIDIILSDLRLPDGSGIDLLKKVREMPSPPAVVLVTGQGDEQVAVTALKAGAADYIVKQSDYLHRMAVVIKNAVAQNNLEREQAAKLEAEGRYQALVEQTPAVVFLDAVDEDETTLYINPKVEDLTGYTPEEWNSDHLIWENNIHPDDQEHVLERDRKTHSSGERFQEEYRFIRRDGQTVWIKEDTSLIRDKDGNPLYWQGILIDITREKEYEEVLQRKLKELTVLNAVTAAGTESTSEDEIITRFVQLSALIYNEICGILLLDNKGGILTPHPSYLGANVSNWKNGTPITQGVTGQCVLSGKAFRLGDVTSNPAYIQIASNVHSELCVPIQVNKRIIGVFNVESVKPNAFDNDDEQFLTTVAGSIGTAIERLRLLETERIRRQEAELLQEATASLSIHIEVESCLNQILDSIMTIVPYDSASIFLEDKNGIMEIVAAKGLSKENDFIGKKIAKSDKWNELTATKKALIMPDAQQDPRFEKWDGSEAIRGWMGIPMIAQEKVVGFINLDSHEVDHFTERDATIAQTFANSAAVAIQNAISFNAEREQRKREAEILDLMQSAASSLDLKEVLEIILSKLNRLLRADTGSIQLLENDKLIMAATVGFNSELFAPDGAVDLASFPINKKVVEEKQAICINDVHKNNDFVQIDGLSTDTRSFLAIPLISKSRSIGLITLDNKNPDHFEDHDVETAIAIANHVSIAVENASLYQDALRASERRAVLHRISQDIVRFTQEPGQVYKAIHEAASKLMPCDVFRIALRDEASKENIFVYTMESGIQYQLPNGPAIEGLTGKVIGTGESVILHTEIETSSYPRFGSPIHVLSALAVPMHFGNKVMGMISAQSYQPNSYGSEEQSLLEMLATHAATAIENTRLYIETQRRLKEMEAINHLSFNMRTTQSQSEMCEFLLDEVLKLLDAVNGSVWIYDNTTNLVMQRAAKGQTTQIKQKIVHLNEGIVGHVMATGEVYITADLKNDQLLLDINRDAVAEGYGGVCIPIYSIEGILGAITIQTESIHQANEQLNLLSTLAEIAGNAIHRADLYDQGQDQIQKLTTLRDIDAAIASSTDLRVTLNILMDHTLRHLKVDAVDIMLYHPELQSLTYLTSAGFRSSSSTRPIMRIGEGLAGQVVMKGRIEEIPDLRSLKVIGRDPLLQREGFVSYIGVPLIVKGQVKGVFEIFHRSPLSTNDEWMQFMHTLVGQAAIAIDNSQLFENIQRSNQEIRQAYDTTLEGWARALELRDRETEGHTRRVTELTMRLARHMNLGEDELVNIYRGVLLHDIGKMGVSDQILKKTGPLNDNEWVEMRKHPQYAFDLLSPIPYLRPALDIPYCHHEHWDGSGYPRGLKGDQIPLPARIFSIVDIWDALLSDRPYRNAWPREKVKDYLKDVSGTLLDPAIVKIFLNMIEEDEN